MLLSPCSADILSAQERTDYKSVLQQEGVVHRDQYFLSTLLGTVLRTSGTFPLFNSMFPSTN